MAEAVQTLSKSTGKGKNIGLWVLQIAVAGMFAMAGISKLAGATQMVGLFDAIGIGQWFRYLTGGIEVTSAVLLLVPGLAAFGAALLICTMIGAVITHLAVMHTSPAVPLMLLVAVIVILWGRREQIAEHLGK